MYIIPCSNIEEFYLSTLTPDKPINSIPVLSNLQQTEALIKEQHFGTAGLEIYQLNKDQAHKQKAVWESLGWNDRFERIKASNRFSIKKTKGNAGKKLRIIVSEGPELVLAALLASAFQSEVDLIIKDIKSAETYTEFIDESYVNWLIGGKHFFTDELMLGILHAFQGKLMTRVNWATLPLISCLTARNMNSLSLLTARLLVHRLNHSASSLKKAKAISLVAAGKNPIIHQNDHTVESNHFAFQTQSIDASEYISALTLDTKQTLNWLTVSTHGFESCADLNGHTVFCGLHSGNGQQGAVDALACGKLACGSGHTCPRGEAQLPLNTIKSDTLMLASCNGLRLEDSILQADFNMGLSYLDGSGINFLSSVYSSVGNAIASVIFSAAMASAYDMVSAHRFVNGFLHHANLEHPCYMMVGDPFYKAYESSNSKSVRIEGSDILKEEGIDLDLEARNVAEIEIRNLNQVEWFNNLKEPVPVLTLPDEKQKVYWFFRKENENQDDPDADQILRLFLFSYPATLSKLKLRFVDFNKTKNTLERITRAHAFWQQMCRYFSTDFVEQNEEVVKALEEIDYTLQMTIPKYFLHCNYSAAALNEVNSLFDYINNVLEVVKESFINYISPKLSHSFWLTNTFSPNYINGHSSIGQCPNCHGNAISKMQNHSTGMDSRHVLICPKCGIVKDFVDYSIFKSARVIVPEKVERGKQMKISIECELNPEGLGRGITICPRIAAIGRYHEKSEPAEYRVIHSGQERINADFTFNIPDTLLPHRYFIKIILATREELAFLSRIFFVV